MPRVRSSLMSLTVQAYIFSLWAILKLQTIIKFSKCIRFYDIWWDKIIPKIFGIGDWFFMVWFYSREQRWTRRCSIPRGNLCELTSPGMEESQQLGEGWGSNRGHGWIPFWDSLLRGGAYIWTDNFWFPRTRTLLPLFILPTTQNSTLWTFHIRIIKSTDDFLWRCLQSVGSRAPTPAWTDRIEC